MIDKGAPNSCKMIFLKKTLTVILAGVFLFTNTLGWAKEEKVFSTATESKALSSSPTDKDKLAPPLGTKAEELKERFLAGEILLSHKRCNEYIAKRIKEIGYDKLLKTSMHINGVENDTELIAIPGLLKFTGLPAHVGLGRQYGKPVIYIDSDLYYNEDIRQHEFDEVSRWEALRNLLGLEPKEMRKWILDHISTPVNNRELPSKYRNKTTRQISEIIHKNSHRTDHLYKRYANVIDYEYLAALTAYDDETEEYNKDVTIAAHEGSPSEEELQAEQFIKGRPEILKAIEPYQYLTTAHGYLPWKHLYDGHGYDITAYPGDGFEKLFRYGFQGLLAVFDENELTARWLDIVELRISAKDTYSGLFYYGFPAIHRLFGHKKFIERWSDIKRMAISQGKDAMDFFDTAVVSLEQLLGKDEFDKNWDTIVDITLASGVAARNFFTRGLPSVGNALGHERFKEYLPLLLTLGKTMGYNAGYHFELDISKDLEALKRRFGQSSFNIYGPELLKLGIATNQSAAYFFEYVFPEVINSLTPANWHDFDKWIRSGYPLDGVMVREFLGLNPQIRTQYLENREVELNKIRAGNFDRNNVIHQFLGYEILLDEIKNHPKIKKSVTYTEYKKFVAENLLGIDFDQKERGEITYLAYESIQLIKFVRSVKAKADQLGRPLVVVENLTYGWLAAIPIEDELEAMGVKIIRTKAGSTFAHGVPMAMHGKSGDGDDADLFSQKDLKYIVENEPIVLVIDGTYSLDPEKMAGFRRHNPRFPDAHQTYRNYFHAISGNPTDASFGIEGLTRSGGTTVKESLLSYLWYGEVRRKANEIRSAEERANYDMLFWYPGKLNLEIDSERIGRPIPENQVLYNAANPDHPFVDKLKGPAIIFAVANVEDTAIPDNVRAKSEESFGGGGLVTVSEDIFHNSAFFDDKAPFERVFIEITNYGPRISEAFPRAVKAEYDRLEKELGLEGLSLAKIHQVPNPMAIKAIISDFDDTFVAFPEVISDAARASLEALLALNIPVAIITEEREENMEARLWSRIAPHLRKNLHIFSNGGTHGFGFDAEGNKRIYFKYNISNDNRAKMLQIVENVLPRDSYSVEPRDYKTKLRIIDKNKRRAFADLLKQAFLDEGINAKISFQGRDALNIYEWGKPEAANYFNEHILAPLNIGIEDTLLLTDKVRSYGADRALFEALPMAYRVNVGSKSPTLRGDRTFHLDRQGVPASMRILNNIVENAGLLNINILSNAYLLKGSPAACLNAIGQNADLLIKAMNKKVGIKIKEVAGLRPYHPSTVYKEFKILKDLGIFVPVEGKRGYYRFSDMMIGPDANYTKTLINAINDMRYQVGKKGEERPLHRWNISDEKIGLVRELVKMAILHQINLIQRPLIPDGKTLWHILEQDVVSVSQRYSFAQEVNKAAENSKAAERIYILKKNESIQDAMARISIDHPNAIFDIALSEEGHIENVPGDIKRLVFKGSAGDVAQLEGIVAALRALHGPKEDIVSTLKRIYAVLNGAAFPHEIPPGVLDDPAKFARSFIFNLPPAIPMPVNEISKMNERLLQLLIAA